jgi:hypothetical protein
MELSVEYISGFFDADGSISLIRIHPNEQKSIQVSLCNNERLVLMRMKEYLFKNYKIKGSVSKKKPRKHGHSANYELKYTRNSALKLIALLNSLHPKKKYRIDIATKYYQVVTIRNGKYNETQLMRKAAFERLFYWKTKKGHPAKAKQP